MSESGTPTDPPVTSKKAKRRFMMMKDFILLGGLTNRHFEAWQYFRNNYLTPTGSQLIHDENNGVPIIDHVTIYSIEGIESCYIGNSQLMPSHLAERYFAIDGSGVVKWDDDADEDELESFASELHQALHGEARLLAALFLPSITNNEAVNRILDLYGIETDEALPEDFYNSEHDKPFNNGKVYCINGSFYTVSESHFGELRLNLVRRNPNISPLQDYLNQATHALDFELPDGSTVTVNPQNGAYIHWAAEGNRAVDNPYVTGEMGADRTIYPDEIIEAINLGRESFGGEIPPILKLTGVVGES